VSVSCDTGEERITIAEGVPWYIKPPSWDTVLLDYCPEYYDPYHNNKCVPCKIPAGVGPVDNYCMYLIDGPEYCIAVDSVPGVYNELDFHEQVWLPIEVPVIQEQQFDLSCEGEPSLHRFTIQNEIWPVEVTDPNDTNNAAATEMLVACLGMDNGGVANLTVPDSPWDVQVCTSEIWGDPDLEPPSGDAPISVDAYGNGGDFILRLEEESPGLGIGPGPTQMDDTDGDGWGNEVEGTVYSNAENDGELSGELGLTLCTNGTDDDGDGYIDGTYAPGGCGGAGCDAGCSTPEAIHVPGTCSDGIDNDGGMFPGVDAADPKCQDFDGDGYFDMMESMLASDPADPTSTPENMQFPWTCDDGVDNDKDGAIDDAEGDDEVPIGDGNDDCSNEQLRSVRPPVTCASGWVTDTDGDTFADDFSHYVYLEGDGKLTVGVNIPLNNLTYQNVARKLVLHCFADTGDYPDGNYPDETIRATIVPQDVHQLDLYTADNQDEGTFDGSASCEVTADLKLLDWQFTPDIPAGFHVDQEHVFTTTKVVHNNGPDTAQDIHVEKGMNVPEGCDGSLKASQVGEEIVVAGDTQWNINVGHSADPGDWTDGPVTLVVGTPPLNNVGDIVYVRENGLEPLANEIEAKLDVLGDVYVSDAHANDVVEEFGIYCSESGRKEFKFWNDLSWVDWPDTCDPDLPNSTKDVSVTVFVDTDADGDTVGDSTDNCVLDYNPGQENHDDDKGGDACDCDDDNGGAPDNQEIILDGTNPLNPADDQPKDTNDTDNDNALNWGEFWVGTDYLDPCSDDCHTTKLHDAWAYDIDLNCWCNSVDILMFPANVNMAAELGVEPTYQCRYDFDGNNWVNSVDILMFPANINMADDCENPPGVDDPEQPWP
jgi:hypothetical protein